MKRLFLITGAGGVAAVYLAYSYLYLSSPGSVVIIPRGDGWDTLAKTSELVGDAPPVRVQIPAISTPEEAETGGAPAISVVPGEFEHSWLTLLAVADQAGLDTRTWLDRSFSLGDQRWMHERMTLFVQEVSSIEEQIFPIIEKVMDRKMLSEDWDVITLDTSDSERHRLKQPTRPGQLITMMGKGGNTYVIRVDLHDDYALEAAHHELKELERWMLFEVMTKLGLR